MISTSNTWIGTLSGKKLDFWAPDPDDICIEDIAAGLSRMPRFSGQTSEFYSVAQHSVLCSWHTQPQNALHGLLHDAAEAYMGDCPRPLKVVLGDAWKGVELRLLSTIFERFGLAPEIPAEVKEIDNRLVVTERMRLQPNSPSWSGAWLDDVEPYDYMLLPAWSEEKARANFLDRFEELRDEMPAIGV